MGELTAHGRREGRVARPAPLAVLNIAAGQDTGGWGARIVDAFRRHSPEWSVRSYASSTSYIDYPRDVRTQAEADELFALADVLHARNTLAGLGRYALRDRRPRDRGVVMQHHGTAFRTASQPKLDEAAAQGALQIVSTLDLKTIAPDVLEWVPTPYNLRHLAEQRRPIDDGKVRIGHAPTNRLVKHTDTFLRAFARLERKHPNVELVLIERKPWRECLRLKGTCDVVYDQLELGIGCNALEAWGMGIPVVAGVTYPGARELMLETWGALPFYEATEQTLAKRLGELVESEELRREWGRIGLAHMQRWHDERLVVEQLERIYHRSLDTARPLINIPIAGRARRGAVVGTRRASDRRVVLAR